MPEDKKPTRHLSTISVDKSKQEATVNQTVQDSLERIDALKAALDAARPLAPYTAASLRDKLALEWTHQANALNGSSMTLRETKVILEGITVAGKSLQEHVAVLNHQSAILYIESMVARNTPMSGAVITTAHRLILKNLDADAGQYRRAPGVTDDMRLLLTWYAQAGAMHPVQRAAGFYARFIRAHPFAAGNGRVGRLILNLDLMQAGYPMTVIRQEDCASERTMTHLIAIAVERSLRTYLDVLALGTAE